MANFERLQELRTGEIRPLNRAALDWLDHWINTPDIVQSAWWEEFEQELREHPVVLGESA